MPPFFIFFLTLFHHLQHHIHQHHHHLHDFSRKIQKQPRKKKLIIKIQDPFFLFIFFSCSSLSYCPFELNWVFFSTDIDLSKNLVLNYPFHYPFSLLFHFPLFSSFFILTTTTQNPFHYTFSLLFPPSFFSCSFIFTTKHRTQITTLKKPQIWCRRELLWYLIGDGVKTVSEGEIYNVERKTALCFSVFGRD